MAHSSNFPDLPRSQQQLSHQAPQANTIANPSACTEATANSSTYLSSYADMDFGFTEPVESLPDLPMFDITDMSGFPQDPDMQYPGEWSADGMPAWPGAHGGSSTGDADPNSMSWEYNAAYELPLGPYNYTKPGPRDVYQAETFRAFHDLLLNHPASQLHKWARQTPQLLEWLPMTTPAIGSLAVHQASQSSTQQMPWNDLSRVEPEPEHAVGTVIVSNASGRHVSRRDSEVVRDWMSLSARYTMWSVVLLYQGRRLARSYDECLATDAPGDYFPVNAPGTAPVSTTALLPSGTELLSQRCVLFDARYRRTVVITAAALLAGSVLLHFSTLHGFFYMVTNMLLVPCLGV